MTASAGRRCLGLEVGLVVTVLSRLDRSAIWKAWLLDRHASPDHCVSKTVSLGRHKLNVPGVEDVDILVVTALFAVDRLDVAAQEPGILPLALGVNAWAVGAVMLTLLNGKVALANPLMVVLNVVARHFECCC